ncbi:hypothetical protein LTR10_012440 [Elasticomyces elasticus]|nr:hypothetical protein LTR10_012440 [Elasticomyces elasticus]KAK4965915.1 hypothetical protein LTR42_011929 [Elasticomyces elasticus]
MACRWAPKANPKSVSFDGALMERCGVTIPSNAFNIADKAIVSKFSGADPNFWNNTIRKDFEGVID